MTAGAMFRVVSTWQGRYVPPNEVGGGLKFLGAPAGPFRVQERPRCPRRRHDARLPKAARGWMGINATAAMGPFNHGSRPPFLRPGRPHLPQPPRILS